MSEIQKGRPTIYGEDQPYAGRRRNRAYPEGGERSGRGERTVNEPVRRYVPGERSGSGRVQPTAETPVRTVSEGAGRMPSGLQEGYGSDRTASGLQNGYGSNRTPDSTSMRTPVRRRNGQGPERPQTGVRRPEGRKQTGFVRPPEMERQAQRIPERAEQGYEGDRAPGYRETPRRMERDWEEAPQQEMRRNDFTSDRKLRALWSVFGILAILLVAAIIYEVVLGNGLKETGAQRMADQNRTQTNAATQTGAAGNSTTGAGGDAAATPATTPATTPVTDGNASDNESAAGDAADSAEDGAGNEDSAADDSADDIAADGAEEDIPTIPLDGDGDQADAVQ